MALFGKKESKEEKQARKQQELLEKYNLDELTDPKDIESVKKIVEELAGCALVEAGYKLGAGNQTDIAKTQTYYQRCIIEQNFIMIRKLEKLIKILEEK